MPFYEYQCKNCGHDLEAMQKISDPPLKKCPHCGKSQLQRLMSAPVFRLKGGGWYETDFKGDKDKQRNLAERPEAQASKDADAKGDAKESAVTTEAKSDAADKPSPAESAKDKEPSADKLPERPAPTVKKPANKRVLLRKSKRGMKAKGKSKARR